MQEQKDIFKKSDELIDARKKLHDTCKTLRESLGKKIKKKKLNNSKNN